MTDIVKRLAVMGSAIYTRGEKQKIANEAAAEIDRLRGLLREVGGPVAGIPWVVPNEWRARRDAALSGADQPDAARSARIALRGILTGRGHEEAALVDIVDEGLGRKPRATDHTAVCSYTGPLVPNEFGKLACPTCGVIPRAADNGSAG